MRRLGPVIATLVFTLLLTSCSTSKTDKVSENSQPLKAQATPSCSNDEFVGGSKWITGQLNAFRKGTLEEAYSFASPSFRQSNGFELFSFLIVGQYSMLLTSKSFQISSCERTGSKFFFTGSLVDNQNNEYTLQYLLSLTDKKWGVDGAQVVKKRNRIDY